MSEYAIASIPDLTPGMPWERGQREDDRLAAWQRYSMWHPALPEVVIQHHGPARAAVWYQTPAARTTGWMRYGCVAALFLLLPFAAQAQEPCKVNVQTCSAQQCAYLPGIGPSKGAAIEAAHPADEAALDAVPGIGDATLAKIRPWVTYQGETTCTSKQAAPKPEAGKDGAQ